MVIDGAAAGILDLYRPQISIELVEILACCTHQTGHSPMSAAGPKCEYGGFQDAVVAYCRAMADADLGSPYRNSVRDGS